MEPAEKKARAPRRGAADDAARATVARQWDAACSRVGFIKVVDHGVPAAVISAAWEAAAEFFLLPLPQKAAVEMTEDYPYGYQAMGSESLQASLGTSAEAESHSGGDIKEMFNVCLGPVGAESDPTFLLPRWPEHAGTMRDPLCDYYRALEALSQLVESGAWHL